MYTYDTYTHMKVYSLSVDNISYFMEYSLSYIQFYCEAIKLCSP